MVEHLYVHIPFCPKICPYCSFYKETGDRHRNRVFLEGLLEEARRMAGRFAVRPRTVFFGGGTPSALATPQLEFLLAGLGEIFDLRAAEEWTLEMNPATVSAEKARFLRGAGVNRISMGVQSWDAGMLRVLGRAHDAGQARRSYEILRESGFGRVNLDLIFGIPGQTAALWRETLRRTLALGPEHISAYCLTYEEDTEFMRRFQRGELGSDTEREAELLECAMEMLEAAGYAQYEISNYARPGEECRHNLAYWLGADYLGLGPSAYSTVGPWRWRNVADTAAYLAALEAGRDPADFRETVTPAMRESERMAFGLRTSLGIAPDALGGKEPEIAGLESAGLLERRAGRWRLTPRGRLVADAVAAELL